MPARPVPPHANQAASASMDELSILLKTRAMHTGRSARNHLLALAQANGSAGTTPLSRRDIT